MADQTIGQRLKDYITLHGSHCLAGVPEEHLLDFERRHGVIMSPDLREYFSELNGTDGEYAYGIIRFWSLDEIRSVTQEISAKRTHKALIHSRYTERIKGGDNYFVFADCMHELQLYAIRMLPSDASDDVILLDGEKPIVVADSFSDFVNRYLSTPEDLRLVLD